MKDSKVARLMRGAALLRQQFAQYRGGVFSQVLGEEAIARIVATHVKDFRDLSTTRHAAAFYRASAVRGSRLSRRGGATIIRARRTRTIREHAQYGFLLRSTRPSAH